MPVILIDPSGEVVDYVTLDWLDIPEWLSIFAADRSEDLANGDVKTFFSGDYAVTLRKLDMGRCACAANYYIRKDARLEHAERKELARLLEKYGLPE